MAKKKRGKGRCVVLMAFLMLCMVGCGASTTRRVDLENSCIVMHNVNVYVDKTGAVETPTATPDTDLTIPLIPGL